LSLQNDLYVGYMIVEPIADGVNIVARCFYAGHDDLFVEGALGVVGLSKTEGGATTHLGALASYRVASDGPSGHGEFLMILEQKLTAEQTAWLECDRGHDIGLELQAVCVVLTSRQTAESARLPLWDGIRVFREPERLHMRRKIGMTMLKPFAQLHFAQEESK